MDPLDRLRGSGKALVLTFVAFVLTVCLYVCSWRFLVIGVLK